MNRGPDISEVIVKCVKSTDIKPGVLCHKQVSKAGTSNCIPHYRWDVVTCPCLWYLLLTQWYYWRVLWQKQVSRARTSNYVAHYLWDVVTCPCPWYLPLAQQNEKQISRAGDREQVITSHIISGMQLFVPALDWGVLCQQQVSRAWTSNYIPHYLWDVINCPVLYCGVRNGHQRQIHCIPHYLWDIITCPCPLYLLLAQHSST